MITNAFPILRKTDKEKLCLQMAGLNIYIQVRMQTYNLRINRDRDGVSPDAGEDRQAQALGRWGRKQVAIAIHTITTKPYLKQSPIDVFIRMLGAIYRCFFFSA